jgi:hypothetical protein
VAGDGAYVASHFGCRSCCLPVGKSADNIVWSRPLDRPLSNLGSVDAVMASFWQSLPISAAPKALQLLSIPMVRLLTRLLFRLHSGWHSFVVRFLLPILVWRPFPAGLSSFGARDIPCAGTRRAIAAVDHHLVRLEISPCEMPQTARALWSSCIDSELMAVCDRDKICRSCKDGVFPLLLRILRLDPDKVRSCPNLTTDCWNALYFILEGLDKDARALVLAQLRVANMLRGLLAWNLPAASKALVILYTFEWPDLDEASRNSVTDNVELRRALLGAYLDNDNKDLEFSCLAARMVSSFCCRSSEAAALFVRHVAPLMEDLLTAVSDGEVASRLCSHDAIAASYVVNALDKLFDRGGYILRSEAEVVRAIAVLMQRWRDNEQAAAPVVKFLESLSESFREQELDFLWRSPSVGQLTMLAIESLSLTSDDEFFVRHVWHFVCEVLESPASRAELRRGLTAASAPAALARSLALTCVRDCKYATRAVLGAADAAMRCFRGSDLGDAFVNELLVSGAIPRFVDAMTVHADYDSVVRRSLRCLDTLIECLHGSPARKEAAIRDFARAGGMRALAPYAKKGYWPSTIVFMRLALYEVDVRPQTKEHAWKQRIHLLAARHNARADARAGINWLRPRAKEKAEAEKRELAAAAAAEAKSRALDSISVFEVLLAFAAALFIALFVAVRAAATTVLEQRKLEKKKAKRKELKKRANARKKGAMMVARDDLSGSPLQEENVVVHRSFTGVLFAALLAPAEGAVRAAPTYWQTAKGKVGVLLEDAVSAVLRCWKAEQNKITAEPDSADSRLIQPTVAVASSCEATSCRLTVWEIALAFAFVLAAGLFLVVRDLLCKRRSVAV